MAIGDLYQMEMTKPKTCFCFCHEDIPGFKTLVLMPKAERSFPENVPSDPYTRMNRVSWGDFGT